MALTLVRNGALIDGNGGPPVPNAAVLIDDNRIRFAGPEQAAPLPDRPLTRLDARGGTILPGLIDTHVHLMISRIDTLRGLTSPFSLPFYEAIDNMRRTLDAGFTSVRDAGGADLGLKQAVEQGLLPGPRMQLSITALSITRGHGDGWVPSGGDIALMAAHPGRPDGICDGVDGVRLKVREVLRAGAEVVNICATGGVLSPTDHPEFVQFSPAELEAIVQEAAFRRGVKVMAHAQGAEGIKNALRAGVRSIEHGIYLDDEAIDLLLEKQAFLVPTLLAPVAVLEIAESEGTMPEYGVRKAREIIEIHSDSVARAHRAGVSIAMGTDAGVMPHGSNARELALMAGVGLSPMEAIVATTRTAAECLGWQDRVGTLEAGKLADLVVCAADPLADLSALQDVDHITLVMKGGKIVKG
jgi:imidazolonepropionase-like amidohydrolase